MSRSEEFDPPDFDPAESMARADALREKAMADRMLIAHEGGGWSYGLFLRWNARRYLLGVAYLAVALPACYGMGLFPLLYLVLGMFLGLYLRDFVWVRGIQKNWPFTVKVTDWDLVREIAGR